MTEISTIIRARLDEGRRISDEDVRQLLAERDALQARVTELERLGKAIAIERNQLIGVLQLAVEQSAETGENEPAWIDPACRILNAGFTKSATLEGKKE